MAGTNVLELVVEKEKKHLESFFKDRGMDVRVTTRDGVKIITVVENGAPYCVSLIDNEDMNIQSSDFKNLTRGYWEKRVPAVWIIPRKNFTMVTGNMQEYDGVFNDFMPIPLWYDEDGNILDVDITNPSHVR